MRRRGAKVIFAVTCLAFAATTALACVSFRKDIWIAVETSKSEHLFQLSGGYFAWNYGPQGIQPPPSFDWYFGTANPTTGGWLSPVARPLPGIAWGKHFPVGTPDAWCYVTALWPCTLLSLALVAQYQFLQRQRRRLFGCCPICNYDLSATPERCPECGWVLIETEDAK